MADYLFDPEWALERRRLDAYAALYDPGTVSELEKLGVGAGWTCLEVGAGSGTIAAWLAGRSGDGGRVVATDIDPRFLADLDGSIEVRRHDIAHDPLEEGAYDLVHTRAVLEHVADRARALAAMARGLRPGGWLLAEEIVRPPRACHPALPALGRLFDGMDELLRRRGGDTATGLWLAEGMVAAGLVDVEAEPRVLVVRSGTASAELMNLSLEFAGERLVEVGAVDAKDLAETLAALRAPGYAMLSAIMIAVRGRAPR